MPRHNTSARQGGTVEPLGPSYISTYPFKITRPINTPSQIVLGCIQQFFGHRLFVPFIADARLQARYLSRRSFLVSINEPACQR